MTLIIQILYVFVIKGNQNKIYENSDAGGETYYSV